LCFFELSTSVLGENEQGYWMDISSPYSLFTYQNPNDLVSVCVENNGVHNLIWVVETGPVSADPDFCIDTAYMQIDFMSVPVLDFETTDESVAGASDGEIALIITEGLPPYTINWSNEEHSETISNLSVGVYLVTVIDDNSCMAEGSDTVSVYNAINGEQIDFVNVYPNPTVDIVQIQSDIDIEYIELYDVEGRKVHEVTVAGKSYAISMGELQSGNYILSIYFCNARVVQKLIVKE